VIESHTRKIRDRASNRWARSIRHRLARLQGVQHNIQIVFRRARACLAQTDIAVIDPPVIHQPLTQKHSRFRSGHGLRITHQLAIRVAHRRNAVSELAAVFFALRTG